MSVSSAVRVLDTGKRSPPIGWAAADTTTKPWTRVEHANGRSSHSENDGDRGRQAVRLRGFAARFWTLFAHNYCFYSRYENISVSIENNSAS